MGTPVTTLFPTIPLATTFAWRSQFYFPHLQIRQDECPIARSNNIYILQDSSGNATGGSGSGTQADPYLIDTTNNLATYISTNWSSDTRFLCKGRFQGTAGLSLEDVADDATISSWGDGEDFICDGFMTPKGIIGTAAVVTWQDAGSGAYSLDLSITDVSINDIHWVRDTGDVGDDYDHRPYKKAGSIAECQSEERTWYWDSASNTIYVQKTVSNPIPSLTDIELDIGEGPMFNFRGIDGLRLHDVKVYGWAINEGQDAPYAITLRPRTTDCAVVSNCDALYSNWHAIGSVSFSSSGGITTCINCRAGWCADTQASPGPTIYVGFCSGGGHEFIMHQCRTFGGTLPEVGRDAFKYSGDCYFMHTSDSSRAALGIVYDHYHRSGTYGGCAGPGIVEATIPALTDVLTSPEDFREWVIMDVFDGNDVPVVSGDRLFRGADVFLNFRINCQYLDINVSSNLDAAGAPPRRTIARYTSSQRGLMVNCSYRLNMTNDDNPTGCTSLITSDSNLRLRGALINCHIDLQDDLDTVTYWDRHSSGNTNFWFSEYFSAFNTIFATNDGVELRSNLHNNTPGNGTSPVGGLSYGTYEGGTRNCAYRNHRVSGTDPRTMGFDSTDSPVTLTGRPTVGELPAASSQLYNAASTDIPFDVEFDQRFERIRTIYNIGPLQPTEVPDFASPTEDRRKLYDRLRPVGNFMNHRSDRGDFEYVEFDLDYGGINYDHRWTRWQIRPVSSTGERTLDFVTTANGPTSPLVILAEADLTSIIVKLNRTRNYEIRIQPNDQPWTDWQLIDLSAEMRRIGGIHRDQETVVKSGGKLIVTNSNPKDIITKVNGRLVVSPNETAKRPSRPSRRQR